MALTAWSGAQHKHQFNPKSHNPLFSTSPSPSHSHSHPLAPKPSQTKPEPEPTQQAPGTYYSIRNTMPGQNLLNELLQHPQRPQHRAKPKPITQAPGIYAASATPWELFPAESIFLSLPTTSPRPSQNLAGTLTRSITSSG